MATYAELLTASEDTELINKINVAVIIAAETVRTEDIATANHAERMAWAKAVFENPRHEGQRMIWAVLAQNKTATLAAILAATDEAVQTAVDAAVNVFTGA